MPISYNISHFTPSADVLSITDTLAGTALAGDLLIAMFNSNQATLPVVSCTGASPVWVKIEDITYGATRRTTIWYTVAQGGETAVTGTWGTTGRHGIELMWNGSPGGYNEAYVIQAATVGTLGGGHMNTPGVHPTGNGEYYIGWTSDDGTNYTFASMTVGALGPDGGDGFNDLIVGGIFHWFIAAHANNTGDSITYSVQTGIPAYQMGILGVRVGTGPPPPPPVTPVSPRPVASWITRSGGY